MHQIISNQAESDISTSHDLSTKNWNVFFLVDGKPQFEASQWANTL